MVRYLLVLAFAFSLLGQTATRSITLTWDDLRNPTGTTYTVYRARGGCAPDSAFTAIKAGIGAKTYADDSVQPGKYCYRVTASFNSEESDPSDTAGAQVKPFKPEALGVTVTITIAQ